MSQLGGPTTAKSSSRDQAKAYRAPRLTAYGPLKTLTRSGSGHAAETDAPPGLPGSNPDPTKRRPG